MRKSDAPSKDSVESIAGTIVEAWRDRHAGDLARQVAAAKICMRTSGAGDTFQMEKMELLDGALELVQSARPEQVEAAIKVLEHLAQGVMPKLRWRSRRA
jgi:hypothetical protein